MFYRLGKKMRKPYGGGGWGVGATTNQNWFSKKKKASTGTELLKIQGYLLLIKSNNRAKQNPVCDQALTKQKCHYRY